MGEWRRSAEFAESPRIILVPDPGFIMNFVQMFTPQHASVLVFGHLTGSVRSRRRSTPIIKHDELVTVFPSMYTDLVLAFTVESVTAEQLS